MSLHLCSLAASLAGFLSGDAADRRGAAAGPEAMAACVALVRSGDQDAARELVARLHPVVNRVVRHHRMRRTPHEDLMQETFIKLFSRLDQYEGGVPIAHWAARIARTTCLDHLRLQQRRPEYRWADMPEHETEALEKTLAAPGQDSAEVIAKRELVATLFSRLPAADQKILRLFVLEERTFHEIGRLTGWSNGMIKIRTFRARRKLHRLFRGLEANEQQMAAQRIGRSRISSGRKP